VRACVTLALARSQILLAFSIFFPFIFRQIMRIV